MTPAMALPSLALSSICRCCHTVSIGALPRVCCRPGLVCGGAQYPETMPTPLARLQLGAPVLMRLAMGSGC